MGRFDHREYVSMTMEFRCNLKCTHCMIEGTMDRLAPQREDQLYALLVQNRMHRKWKGLILTGSEITLHRDLPEWARAARESGFERVRIQTHGMRLANPDYCTELVDAGVNEFFVSVAAADAATHDGITGVPGSFDKTLRGLELLDARDDVLTITNTVVTERSYRQMPALVERLAHLKRLAQMEFWFYFPMSETDDKNLVASHLDTLPPLRRAIAAARALGRGIEVKNFPECLLGDERAALYNDQPELFIDDAFWKEFARNGFYQCAHRSRCGSRQCLGLNTAYIRKFGWHEDRLQPLAPG
ncbi:MAG TPA: radical SAM protein [Noviherbaspirillum sp.]|jgi:MoaA/NifB/PqqE/SkfB family radical SAM enzyme|uniref:radical SAM protein n=1 Tax=Noviherbaspirillum sp. TaxID=1926288 RepID=UPI002F933E34